MAIESCGKDDETCCSKTSKAYSIGEFVSVAPVSQSSRFVFPSSHRFQKIIETGEALTNGGIMPIRNDFAGYVPINESSFNGYLSISSETIPGGVTILDINLNKTTKLWETTSSTSVDFSSVAGTAKNCSGTVTPWGTILTSEEEIDKKDSNSDGYYDLGWTVEIDPVLKKVIDKRWALGNFKHENATIHPNERTLYQGADSKPGYLYKFVADHTRDLSFGKLYVYVGPKEGNGNWVQINNTSPQERNTTLLQSREAGATVFNGIEDVEIGPDGKVYFAVKGEGLIYRFRDDDPINAANVAMEVFVGDMSYFISHEDGETEVAWGLGNDNLAFDGDGNLWVLQDGGDNYIWVVEKGHTQESPKIKLFGIAPIGSEPTGITFTPNYDYLFLSIQHPSAANESSIQVDAAGSKIEFNNHITIVIGLAENLRKTL